MYLLMSEKKYENFVSSKTMLLRIFLCTIILSSLILTTGCHKIAEFDNAFDGGLYVISSQDFATTNYVSGISGARSLLIYPGNIFVASTEGMVLRYDSENMALVEECVVGSPCPSGYAQMVLNATGNSAYLITSLGQIVELSLPECTVKDIFSVCQSPVAIAFAPGIPSYLYVGDGPTRSIIQVSTTTNTPLASAESFFNVNCIEPGWFADTILVGTSDPLTLLEEHGWGSFSLNTAAISGAASAIAIAAIPYDSNFVVVTPSSVGVLEFFEDPLPGESFGAVLEMVNLEGSSHCMAMGTDWQHAYILSYVGDFTSRLTSYNYVFNEIDQQVDLPGFPFDIKTTSSGYIYVLTSE